MAGDPMIKAKDGVRFASVDQAAAFVFCVVGAVYAKRGYLAVLTSAVDSQHRSGSFHYIGAAWDFRTKQLPRGELEAVVSEIRELLGEQYDVILEDEAERNEHLHIEFQPKSGA